MPVLVPNRLSDPCAYFDTLQADILILTGGDNIGETPERDETELKLIDHTLIVGKPILGICRGMQLINQHFGGALTPINGHAGSSHTIKIAEPWHEFYRDESTVNSFHNLGIAPEGLAAKFTAWATDDTKHIEAFHHTEQPIIGLMWHPERELPLAGDRRVFEKFAKEGAFWA